MLQRARGQPHKTLQHVRGHASEVGAQRSLSTAFVEFALSTMGRPIPDAVLHAARRQVLDTLGVASVATTQPFAHRLRQVVTPTHASRAVALGVSQRCTAPDAAFVNGVLAHGLDFDDTFQPGIVHVGAIVIPTALAVSAVEGSSNDDTLTSIVLGYELATRLAIASPAAFHLRGFHPTPICGAFAAALTAALLMRLDQDQMVNALGLAGSLASGVQQFLEDGTEAKQIHAGWAALAGIRAATLAKAGFSGPAAIWEGRYGLYATHVGLEHFDRAALVDGLGTRWNVLRMSVKPYPCCHFLHAHIDAVRSLRRLHGLTADQVRRVRCLIHPAGLTLVAEPIAEKKRPSTPYGAKFSLPYTVAVALVHGNVDTLSFAEERLREEEVLAVAERTECRVDLQSHFPEYFDGGVELELFDGSVLTHREAVNRGSAERPLSDAELVQKFGGNLEAAGIRRERAKELAHGILAGGDVRGVAEDVNRGLLHGQAEQDV